VKVLHVITDLKVGGESKHLVRVVASLRSIDHVVSCLTLTTRPEDAPGSTRQEFEELGVPVVNLGVSPKRPLSVVRAFWRLYRLAAREKPDVIHATLIHANLLSQPLSWFGFPVMCTYVVTDPWRREWERHVERYAGHRAIFVANARAVADTLVAGGIRPERIRILHYGVDCDHFRPEGLSADIPQGDPILLGVGRLHPQKGFEDLIQAAALLPLQPRVVLLGDGPLRGHLMRCSHEAQVELTVIPAVQDIAPFLRRADVVALPSRYEGLPNVLLEALAAGCTVVASDLPGHREVIRSGENGLLVPPADVHALSQAIQRAMSDDGSLGANGRQTMLTHFHWNTYVERRRRLYESIAGLPGGAFPRDGTAVGDLYPGGDVRESG
jgi:glycosyltransferase involved in cell wall biosynthesis